MTSSKTVDRNMLRLIEILLESGRARFQKEICDTIGQVPQTLRNIRIGKQHFTVENIRLMALKYNVNLNFIFGLEDEIFNAKPVGNRVSKKRPISKIQSKNKTLTN